MKETITKCDRCGRVITETIAGNFAGEPMHPGMDGAGGLDVLTCTWSMTFKATFQHGMSDGPTQADLCGQCTLIVVQLVITGRGE